MSFTRLSLLATTAMILTLFRISSISGRLIQILNLSNGQKAELLNEHNRVRGLEPAANMQRMVWDNNLEALAREQVSLCNADHSRSSFRRKKAGFRYIGENIWWSSEKVLRSSLAEIINQFYVEKKDYHFPTGSCTPGRMCGHYTQVVWADTCALGCAISKCAGITNGAGIRSGHILFCHYGEGGNIVGKKPYVIGQKCGSQCKQGCGPAGLCNPTCTASRELPSRRPKPTAAGGNRLHRPLSSSSSPFLFPFPSPYWSGHGGLRQQTFSPPAAYNDKAAKFPQRPSRPSNNLFIPSSSASSVLPSPRSGADRASRRRKACRRYRPKCSKWASDGQCTGNREFMKSCCHRECRQQRRKYGQAKPNQPPRLLPRRRRRGNNESPPSKTVSVVVETNPSRRGRRPSKTYTTITTTTTTKNNHNGRVVETVISKTSRTTTTGGVEEEKEDTNDPAPSRRSSSTSPNRMASSSSSSSSSSCTDTHPLCPFWVRNSGGACPWIMHRQCGFSCNPNECIKKQQGSESKSVGIGTENNDDAWWQTAPMMFPPFFSQPTSMIHQPFGF